MITFHKTDFGRIADIAQKRWGLHITESKYDLVTARMSKYLRKSHFCTMCEYLDFVEKEATKDDLLSLFDVLSTNMTSFFRERQHFDFLEREFYTPLNRGNLTLNKKKLRIWSAACSTGAEPYTIAMHAMEHLNNWNQFDFKILATDLSNSVLDKARSAIYPADEITDLQEEYKAKYFIDEKSGTKKRNVKIAPLARDLVTIRRLNLIDPWPFSGPFDIIFCRNVLFYFNKSTRIKIVHRMLDVLRPGGLLIVGSAESLNNLNIPIRTAQPSVYVK